MGLVVLLCLDHRTLSLDYRRLIPCDLVRKDIFPVLSEAIDPICQQSAGCALFEFTRTTSETGVHLDIVAGHLHPTFSALCFSIDGMFQQDSANPSHCSQVT